MMTRFLVVCWLAAILFAASASAVEPGVSPTADQLARHVGETCEVALTVHAVARLPDGATALSNAPQIDDAALTILFDPPPTDEEREALRALLGKRFVARGVVEARDQRFGMRMTVAALLAAAQETSTTDETIALKVWNDVGGGAAWSLEQLETLPREKIGATERDGTAVEYEGVALATVLARSGVEMGEGRRGVKMPAYLTVTAADGYQAVFSLAEVDPFLSNNVDILALRLQGEQLPDTVGPLRIVAPADKHPRRWVRQVQQLRVRVVKLPAP